MANHPNRSQRTYQFIANVCEIHFTKHELKNGASETWASGPTHNNRPAAQSIATRNVDELIAHICKQQPTVAKDDLRKRIAVMQIGDVISL